MLILFNSYSRLDINDEIDAPILTFWINRHHENTVTRAKFRRFN